MDHTRRRRDLGASSWQTLRHVVLPILLPGIMGVALFGFTLSYDDFARTLLPVGPRNALTLPPAFSMLGPLQQGR
jgi:putative spermidine/putrescine transport system permease protein